jgi:hypothetical protein
MEHVDGRLRPQLANLQHHVFNKWVENKDDNVLHSAAMKLTVAVASLQRTPVTLGAFIIQRSRPYFTEFTLFTEDELDVLRRALDSRGRNDLDAALEADSLARTLSGYSVSG